MHRCMEEWKRQKQKDEIDYLKIFLRSFWKTLMTKFFFVEKI